MDLDRYKSDDLQRDQRQLEDLKRNLLNLLRIKYATIVALLASGFYNLNPILTAISIFISFMIFFIEINYRKKICRNAAYLIVFYGQEVAPEWESRFHEYRKTSLKITRTKEFLKKFSKIKAPEFLRYKKNKIVRWLDKRIVRFFLISLNEENSIQNFYIVELLVTTIVTIILACVFLLKHCSPLWFFDSFIFNFIINSISIVFLFGSFLLFIKVCWFFGKVFYHYKVDYEKEIDVWIRKWIQIKKEEKTRVIKELVSKFESDFMTLRITNLIEKNSNADDISLELLNSSLQISMKSIILTRLLNLNSNYQDITKDEEIKALLDVWKKL